MKKLLFLLFLIPSLAWAQQWNWTNSLTWQLANDTENLTGNVQNQNITPEYSNIQNKTINATDEITLGTLPIARGGANTTKEDNGQTAFGWGNHASGGYAVQTNLTNHTSLTNNPHSVTKAQVGLDNMTDVVLSATDPITYSLGAFGFNSTLKALYDGYAANITTLLSNYFNKTRGNWKVFYSNDTGVIIELALGGAGTFLKANGIASAPTWDTPAGTGNASSNGAVTAGNFSSYVSAGLIQDSGASTSSFFPTSSTIGGNNLTNLTWAKLDNIPANTTSDQATNTTASPTFGNLTVTTALNIAEGGISDSDIVSADIKNGEIVVADTAITAGRSLTWSTNDMVADAELYTDTKCIIIENATIADDFPSIFIAKQAATITNMWGESNQTITWNLLVDDGSPANVNTTDLTMAAGVVNQDSPTGDVTLAAGDRLDLNISAASGAVPFATCCFTFSYDD